MNKNHYDRIELIERLERKYAKKVQMQARKLQRSHLKESREAFPEHQLRIGVDFQEPADLKFPQRIRAAF